MDKISRTIFCRFFLLSPSGQFSQFSPVSVNFSQAESALVSSKQGIQDKNARISYGLNDREVGQNNTQDFPPLPNSPLGKPETRDQTWGQGGVLQNRESRLRKAHLMQPGLALLLLLECKVLAKGLVRFIGKCQFYFCGRGDFLIVTSLLEILAGLLIAVFSWHLSRLTSHDSNESHLYRAILGTKRTSEIWRKLRGNNVTRLGATRPRVSERKSSSERVSKSASENLREVHWT